MIVTHTEDLTAAKRIRRANATYRRASKRGEYAKLRARRILERDVIAMMEGRK